MKTIIAALLFLFISSTAYSTETVRIWFAYDNLGFAPHAVASVGVLVNGTVVCSDDSPAIDADGTYNYSCSEQSFPPGEYTFGIRVISMSGDSTDSDLAMGTIPPVPEPDPDMPQPTIQRIEVERDDEGVVLIITT